MSRLERAPGRSRGRAWAGAAAPPRL